MKAHGSLAVIAMLVTVAGCFPVAPGAEEQAPRDAAPPTSPARKEARVVIITGNDYPGHKWRETAPVLARQLRGDPRLEVEVEIGGVGILRNRVAADDGRAS